MRSPIDAYSHPFYRPWLTNIKPVSSWLDEFFLPRRARRATSTPGLLTDQGEDPRAVLGRIVNRERLRLGISQEELADRVGLDRTYVGGIERGVRNPTFLVLLRLAQVLNVPPGNLVAMTV